MTLAARIDAAIAECDLAGVSSPRPYLVEARAMLDSGATITRLPCRWSSDPQKDFEAEYANWTNLSYDAARDRFYLIPWHGVLESFDPVAQKWTELTPSLGGGIHNRTLAVDPHNDRLWVGTGTGSWKVQADPLVAECAYFDLATTPPALVLAPQFNGWGSECACYLDAPRKRFIIYGGWGLMGVKLMSLDPLAQPVKTGIARPWVSAPREWTAAQKMTHWRGGVDTKRERCLYVDVNSDVWALDNAALTWSKLYAGPGYNVPGHPHPHTQYVYHAALDALVGWTSSSAIAGGDPQVPIYKLWLFRCDDPRWVETPYTINEPAHNWTYVGFQMIYDPVRKHVLMHGTAGNYNPSTWVIQV